MAELAEDVEVGEVDGFIDGDIVAITALFTLAPGFEQMRGKDSPPMDGNIRPSQQAVDSAACCTFQDSGMLVEVYSGSLLTVEVVNIERLAETVSIWAIGLVFDREASVQKVSTTTNILSLFALLNSVLSRLHQTIKAKRTKRRTQTKANESLLVSNQDPALLRLLAARSTAVSQPAAVQLSIVVPTLRKQDARTQYRVGDCLAGEITRRGAAVLSRDGCQDFCDVKRGYDCV